jgi:hypothetical protein
MTAAATRPITATPSNGVSLGDPWLATFSIPIMPMENANRKQENWSVRALRSRPGSPVDLIWNQDGDFRSNIKDRNLDFGFTEAERPLCGRAKPLFYQQ